MRAARRQRGAAGALVVDRARARGCRAWDLRADLRRDGVALAVRGRDQAVAAPLLDLPARPAVHRQGRPHPRPVWRPLGRRAAAPGDYVVCCDEKPSIQARARKHATLPAAAGIGRGQRVEHEYERKGALCYLAAWDAKRAKLFDRCAPKDGIEPFDQLVEQFMTVEPYSKAQRVFVIVDNGSAHRGQRSIDRLQGAWSNLTLVHTPVHASWLNQAEIYFSIVQRKVADPQRLPRPRHARAAATRVRPPLRADRRAVRVEVHARRPRPPRPAPRPTRRPGRLNEYVGELPSQST